MHNPLEITFKGIVHNRRIEDLIQIKFNKIRTVSNGILKCHVVMEKVSKHHKKGNAYCVKLDLKRPHFSDIVIKEESKEGELPLSSAIRSVFKKAQGAIKEQVERRRKKVPRPDKEGDIAG